LPIQGSPYSGSLTPIGVTTSRWGGRGVTIPGSGEFVLLEFDMGKHLAGAAVAEGRASSSLAARRSRIGAVQKQGNDAHFPTVSAIAVEPISIPHGGILPADPGSCASSSESYVAQCVLAEASHHSSSTPRRCCGRSRDGQRLRCHGDRLSESLLRVSLGLRPLEHSEKG